MALLVRMLEMEMDLGIDFKTDAEGNEWRWTEQWIPHAAWFLCKPGSTYCMVER